MIFFRERNPVQGQGGGRESLWRGSHFTAPQGPGAEGTLARVRGGFGRGSLGTGQMVASERHEKETWTRLWKWGTAEGQRLEGQPKALPHLAPPPPPRSTSLLKCCDSGTAFRWQQSQTRGCRAVGQCGEGTHCSGLLRTHAYIRDSPPSRCLFRVQAQGRVAGSRATRMWQHLVSEAGPGSDPGTCVPSQSSNHLGNHCQTGVRAQCGRIF